MQPPPDGVWGLPQEMLDDVPGYGPDVAKNRAEARAIMEKLGYGPDKRLKLKVSTRNHLLYRDPAVILIDQLKEIYIDGELELVDTAVWFTKIARKDYAIGAQHDRQRRRRSRPDLLRALRLQVGAQLHRLLQSRDREAVRRAVARADLEKRKKIVWEIDRKLLEDGARPIIMWNALGDLLAALRQGLQADGQQPLQRLALRGHLARQVGGMVLAWSCP